MQYAKLCQYIVEIAIVCDLMHIDESDLENNGSTSEREDFRSLNSTNKSSI